MELDPSGPPIGQRESSLVRHGAAESSRRLRPDVSLPFLRQSFVLCLDAAAKNHTYNEFVSTCSGK